MARPRFTLERGGESIELAQGENLVGRGRSCAVVVIDPSVSRNHALVNVEGDRASVTDLGSANGTYVNGERVTTERYLADGDQILFGETELEICVAQIEAVPVDTSQVENEESKPRSVTPIDPRLFFCSECGADLDGGRGVCPECGYRVGDAPLSRSEAISAGEVMPVGELLAASAPDLLETGPRLNLPRGGENRATTPDKKTHDLELVPDRDEESEDVSDSEVIAVESIPLTDLTEPAVSMEAAASQDPPESVDSLSLDSTDPVGSLDPDSDPDPDSDSDSDDPAVDEMDSAESSQSTEESFASLDTETFDSGEPDLSGALDLETGDAEWLDDTAANSAPAALDAYPLGDSQTVGELMALESSEEAPGSQTVSDLLGSPPPEAADEGELIEESTAPVSPATPGVPGTPETLVPPLAPATENLPTIEETLPVTDTAPRPLAVPPIPISGSDPKPRPSSPAVDPYRIAVRSTPPGGFWRRLAAWIVDGLLFSGVGAAVSLAFGGPTEPLGLQAGGLVASILGFLVPLIGWAGPGTTPGKRIFDLWVCNPDEEAGIGLGRALVRLIGYALGAALLGIGFLMIPFNASKRGLHDILAGTRVIVGRP